MARINKRSMLVSIGGTEFNTSLSSASIEADDSDSDFITFADAAAGGGRQYTFKFTAPQDPATGTLWDMCFSNPGTTVAIIYKPQGGTSATPGAPWFTFNAVVKEPNGTFLGGDADPSTTAVQTIEGEWSLLAKPIKQIS